MQKIDRKEAARELGVSPFTVGVYVRGRRIPHYRVGRRIVFDRDEIREWLAARRVPEDAQQPLSA